MFVEALRLHNFLGFDSRWVEVSPPTRLLQCSPIVIDVLKVLRRSLDSQVDEVGAVLDLDNATVKALRGSSKRTRSSDYPLTLWFKCNLKTESSHPLHGALRDFKILEDKITLRLGYRVNEEPLRLRLFWMDINDESDYPILHCASESLVSPTYGAWRFRSEFFSLTEGAWSLWDYVDVLVRQGFLPAMRLREEEIEFQDGETVRDLPGYEYFDKAALLLNGLRQAVISSLTNATNEDSSPDHNTLGRALRTLFNRDELDWIGNELGIYPEDVPGDTVSARSLQLIRHCEHRSLYDDLAKIIKRERPEAW